MMFWRSARRNRSTAVRPAATPIDAQSTRTDVVPTLNQRVSIPKTPNETFHLAYRPASEHAAELLSWLQGPGGRVGYMTWLELHAAYGDMSRELGLEPMNWTAVARELRRLIPQPKRYVGPNRVRMWQIPSAKSQQ